MLSVISHQSFSIFHLGCEDFHAFNLSHCIGNDFAQFFWSPFVKHAANWVLSSVFFHSFNCHRLLLKFSTHSHIIAFPVPTGLTGVLQLSLAMRHVPVVSTRHAVQGGATPLSSFVLTPMSWASLASIFSCLSFKSVDFTRVMPSFSYSTTPRIRTQTSAPNFKSLV